MLAAIIGFAAIAWASWRSLLLARLHSAFVADVSHELRTPLAVMRLYTEMLEQGFIPDEERARALGVVSGEMRRLGRLVDDMLDLARIQRGRRTYDRTPVDAAAVAAQVLATWRPELERLGFRVQADLGTACRMVGDAGALAQVLANLVANAVKFSPERRELDLGVRRQGRDLIIAISDRGIGIPAADRGRLFTPFHRAANARAAAIPGSGLGLALARRIIAAHGGDITALPRSDGGTTMRIRLPGADDGR